MGLKDIGTVKETTDVLLYHPATSEPLMNEDGTQMSVTIHGPYSPVYKKINHDQQNRRLMKAQRTGGKLNLTAEEIEASSMDLLVKCVADWNITLDKKPEPFSQEMVREVFTNYPWVREQVDSAFADTRAFLG